MLGLGSFGLNPYFFKLAVGLETTLYTCASPPNSLEFTYREPWG